MGTSSIKIFMYCQKICHGMRILVMRFSGRYGPTIDVNSDIFNISPICTNLQVNANYSANCSGANIKYRLCSPLAARFTLIKVSANSTKAFLEYSLSLASSLLCP